MVNSGLTEPPDEADAAALRRKLRRLAEEISDGSCVGGEVYDELERVAAALRAAERRMCAGEMNGKATEIQPPPPREFLCPISGRLMRDPVVIASGMTFDRRFVEDWLSAGHRTCPQTEQVLSSTLIVPNHLVRGLISQWCAKHGVRLPPLGDRDEDLISDRERSKFESLVAKISSSGSISEQKQAVSELRQLTRRNSTLRAIVGERPDAISQLVSVVTGPGLRDSSREVVEDVVTTILNFAIHDSNKKVIGDDPEAIPFLVGALQGEHMETRRNAAAALFTLSALDSNKVKIGELGAMAPLVELLDVASDTARKDAASAIFNLCVLRENKARALGSGIVELTLKLIGKGCLVDECLAILALLSSDTEAVELIGEVGGVAEMLRVVRESQCKRNKENAVVVLFAVCMYDRTKMAAAEEEEEESGTLSWLAEHGTSRARRKAAGILEKLRRRRSCSA